MKPTRLALVATLALLLGAAPLAAAAPAATRSSNGDFCAVSKGVAQYLANLANTLRAAPTPTKLKAEWTAITAAGPAMKASAPAKLKGSVGHVMTLANTIAADLKKANWSITGLMPYMSTLTAQMTKATPSINALKSYYRTTCKFDV